MGGGKRKFNQVKYVPKEKKLGKFVEEETTKKDPEDVKSLIDLWNKKKKEDSN